MKLYFIVSGEFVKVGLASDVRRRLEVLRTGNPHPMRIAAWRTVPAAMARYVEKAVHVKLADYAHFGEWFRLDVKVAIDASTPVIALAMRANGELRNIDFIQRTRARTRALEIISEENQGAAIA